MIIFDVCSNLGGFQKLSVVGVSKEVCSSTKFETEVNSLLQTENAVPKRSVILIGVTNDVRGGGFCRR